MSARTYDGDMYYDEDNDLCRQNIANSVCNKINSERSLN